MENNQNIQKINNLILQQKSDDENELSLDSLAKLINKVISENAPVYNNYLKKINNKLGNNFSYFNYKATSLKANDNNIEINLECNVIREHIVIDKKTMTIISKFKDKDLFIKLLKPELVNLLNDLNVYEYLNNLSIKTIYQDFNINIDNKSFEIFAFKSPNWTIMGKSFSLKYLYYNDEFIYDVDHIGLKNALIAKEHQFLNSVFIDIKKLPLELQEKYINSKKSPNEKSNQTNLIVKLINKITNIMKK